MHLFYITGHTGWFFFVFFKLLTVTGGFKEGGVRGESHRGGGDKCTRCGVVAHERSLK